MIEKKTVIKNKTGLHARPAAVIVQKANEFKSDIFLQKEEDRINAKSIMGVMMLAAGEGSQVNVIAEGDDEEKAIVAIVNLLQSDIDSEVKT